MKPYKIVLISVLTLLIGLPAFGQGLNTTSTPFWADPFNHPMVSVYLVMAFIVITIILVLMTLIYMIRVLNLLTRQNEKERAEKAGVKYVATPSFLEKIWQDINASVPVAKEQDIDLGHSYDGIRELDNHLPPWWKGLFYGCIIWGIGYFIFYHVTNTFPLAQKEYQNELAQADENARALKASKPAEVIDGNTLTYSADVAFIEKGKAVFAANNCGSCHRQDGGGNTIGPNLTDKYWLHGGSIRNIYAIINTGVVEKGMPAWGKVMSAADVRNLAYYIMSLQGNEPKDGKAPQGELYQPTNAPVKADSTTAMAN